MLSNKSIMLIAIALLSALFNSGCFTTFALTRYELVCTDESEQEVFFHVPADLYHHWYEYSLYPSFYYNSYNHWYYKPRSGISISFYHRPFRHFDYYYNWHLTGWHHHNYYNPFWWHPDYRVVYHPVKSYRPLHAQYFYHHLPSHTKPSRTIKKRDFDQCRQNPSARENTVQNYSKRDNEVRKTDLVHVSKIDKKNSITHSPRNDKRTVTIIKNQNNNNKTSRTSTIVRHNSISSKQNNSVPRNSQIVTRKQIQNKHIKSNTQRTTKIIPRKTDTRYKTPSRLNNETQHKSTTNINRKSEKVSSPRTTIKNNNKKKPHPRPVNSSRRKITAKQNNSHNSSRPVTIRSRTSSTKRSSSSEKYNRPTKTNSSRSESSSKSSTNSRSKRKISRR